MRIADLRIEPKRQERPLVVEYAPGVLEAIRTHVVKGLDADDPDGTETGGVLFGIRSRHRVSVTAVRPVACSHINGPEYILTEADQLNLEQTLSPDDPAFSGLTAVGLFISHARDSLFLRPSDEELFNRYFPEDWNIVLIVRPGQVGLLRAATIGRTPGSLQPTVLQEFVIRQAAEEEPGQELVVFKPEKVKPNKPFVTVRLLPGLMNRIQEAKQTQEPQLLEETEATLEGPAEAEVHAQPEILTPPAVENKPNRRRLYTAAAIAALILTAGIVAIVSSSTAAPLGLQAFEREGIMHVVWNPRSRVVTQAVRGKIEFVEGGYTTVRDLTADDLKQGWFATLRRNADFTVRLRLIDGRDNAQQELTHYVGHPVARQGDATQRTVDMLRSLNQDLRNDLDRERQRSAELESRNRVLQKIIRAQGPR